MRLLKNKIQASIKAKKRLNSRNRKRSTQTTPKRPEISFKATKVAKNETEEAPKRRKRLKGSSITPKIYLETKNIVTNFGKAIVSFAASNLATPYLEMIVNQLQGENVGIELMEFEAFIKNTKGNIGSIDSLRMLMLEDKIDTPLVSGCKRMFRMIAEVFIKYFSVNWIIHSRIAYKMAHLKFRHRMLRRVRNPETFTYLKGYHGRRRELRKEKE